MDALDMAKRRFAPKGFKREGSAKERKAYGAGRAAFKAMIEGRERWEAIIPNPYADNEILAKAYRMGWDQERFGPADCDRMGLSRAQVYADG